jgi:hypothetical protein
MNPDNADLVLFFHLTNSAMKAIALLMVAFILVVALVLPVIYIYWWILVNNLRKEIVKLSLVASSVPVQVSAQVLSYPGTQIQTYQTKPIQSYPTKQTQNNPAPKMQIYPPEVTENDPPKEEDKPWEAPDTFTEESEKY